MDYMYGVDIGGTNIKLGIMEENGVVQDEGMISTDPKDGPERVAARIREWFDSRGGADFKPVSAGIGCAGLVDAAGGLLFSSPNLPGWENVNMEEVFSNALEMPVVVDNDVNCAAYGEFLFGAGKGVSDFFCVTLGTGVGGGLIIGGSLYRGFSGQAGEIGHTKILAGGELCSCGSKGCLEAYVKASAIVERTGRYIEKGVDSILSIDGNTTVNDISRAAENGDEAAKKALAETGWYFGIGLANIVHLLNPEVIAVGGGISGAGDLIMEPARESFREHVMDDILLKVRIVKAELGNSASFMGAAMLSLDKVRC